PRWSNIRGILRLGWPASLMQRNELLGWYIFMAILVGAFNVPGEPPVHTDAGWIVLRYMHLSFMPAVGLSIALTSIVGKYVGAGDEETAIRRIWLGLALTIAYMSVCAGAFVVFREQLVGVFIDADQEPEAVDEVVRLGATMLIVAAAFQFFDAVAISLAGALRGAGDTVWPGIVTIVLTWVVLVGGGYTMVVAVPQWESLGPWMGAAGYIFFLALAFFWRFLRGGWKGKAVAGPQANGSHTGEPPVELERCAAPVTGDLGAPDPPRHAADTRETPPGEDPGDRA
ncbi:MAG: MATE family efflux transporter, partial [Planctomycetota bacterium]